MKPLHSSGQQRFRVRAGRFRSDMGQAPREGQAGAKNSGFVAAFPRDCPRSSSRFQGKDPPGALMQKGSGGTPEKNEKNTRNSLTRRGRRA
jgi:hypothetical protein